MAQPPAKPGWGASIAKWLGLQVAAKAVSLALGLPIVGAAVMGALAYLDDLPLAQGFLWAMITAASVSVFLNHARAFLLSYSVTGKVQIVAAKAEAALTSKDEKGYGVTLMFRNEAQFPIEYEVQRVSLHLNGRIVDQQPFTGHRTTGGVIPSGRIYGFGVGVAPTGLLDNENLFGEVDITYAYGRPGKLDHTEVKTARVQVITADAGKVVETRLHS